MFYPNTKWEKIPPKQTNLAWAPRVLLDEGMLSLRYFKVWFRGQMCVSFHGYPSKCPTNKWNTGIYKLSKSYSSNHLSPNNAWFIRFIRSLFAGCFISFCCCGSCMIFEYDLGWCHPMVIFKYLAPGPMKSVKITYTSAFLMTPK